MPITVQVPEGALTEEGEREVFAKLTESILRINGVTGNPFTLRHLIGDLHTTPAGKCYAAGVQEDYTNVTLRVPIFSLNSDEQRQQFVTEITETLVKASEGRIKEDRVYVNMIYGDGFWGIGGKSYTNYQLQNTVMDNQPAGM